MNSTAFTSCAPTVGQRHTFQKTALALGVLALSGLASAQSTATDKAAQLDTIVVTAAGFEQKVKDAPASVSVIDREALANKPYAGLADALRDIEGVDVGADLDKNGNISITMRGLPKDYTLVLIDGRRQSDVGDIGPNNFGNSQFMYMPPLAAIERIEVVRGPMSTLYGADAIGGVINIITRKVPKVWGGSIAHSLTLQENSQFGDDQKTDLFAAGPLIDGLLGASVRASRYVRDQSNPGYDGAVYTNGNGTVFQDSGSFGDKKIVAAQNWNAGVTLNLTPHQDHDLSLSYDIAKQRYDNTEGQTGTLDSVDSLWRASRAGVIQPRVGYTPHQRVEREEFVLSHTGRWDIGSLQSSLTKSRSENLGRSLPLTVSERQQLQAIWNQAATDQGVAVPTLTDPLRQQLEQQFLPRPLRTLKIDNLILDTKFNTDFEWNGLHAMTIGGQYFHAEMEDGVFGMDGAGFRDGTSQDHKQWAIFAEDSWQVLDPLTITLGARYDNHNIFGDQISPRAYVTFNQSDMWTFKGGVSTGYKTPKPNELFAGITGFGGQGVSPFVGTPDLQPETSVNYELGAYFDNLDNFSSNITVFFNDFKDKIATADNVPNCFNASGQQALSADCVNIGPGWAELGYTSFRQSTNIDSAQTFGVELGGRWDILSNLKLSANYTYTDSEVKSGKNQGLPLVNTPEHMLNSTLTWNPSDRLALSLISEYRDERYRGTATSTGPQAETRKLYYKSYELFHLGANYKVNDSLSLNGRINNLLDKDMAGRNCEKTFDDTGAHDSWSCSNDYNVTEKARSLWLSANYTF